MFEVLNFLLMFQAPDLTSYSMQEGILNLIQSLSPTDAANCKFL